MVDGNLRVKSGANIDFEKLTYNSFDENGNSIKVLSIKVTVIDSGGYTAIGNFQVRIEDTNDVPTDIILSGQTFSVDFSGGEIVGKLIVEDQDLDETFTYSVDNENFEIVDGYLRIKSNAVLPSALGAQIEVNVSVTDSAGNTFTKAFQLNNSDLAIDNSSFSENVENAVVATISIGSESLSNWTISLEGGDAQYFEINGDGQIQFKGSADFEAKVNYEVIIVVTNNEGVTYKSYQSLQVLDSNDVPDI